MHNHSLSIPFMSGRQRSKSEFKEAVLKRFVILFGGDKHMIDIYENAWANLKKDK